MRGKDARGLDPPLSGPISFALQLPSTGRGSHSAFFVRSAISSRFANPRQDWKAVGRVLPFDGANDVLTDRIGATRVGLKCVVGSAGSDVGRKVRALRKSISPEPFDIAARCSRIATDDLNRVRGRLRCPRPSGNRRS